jgi:hypothetical protein
MTTWPAGKREHLHELLGLLGNSAIDVETFWLHMRAAGLTDDDIDNYCVEEQHGITPEIEPAPPRKKRRRV